MAKIKIIYILMKDEDYSSEKVDSLTHGAVAPCLVKSSIFTGKTSFRVLIKGCTNIDNIDNIPENKPELLLVWYNWP